MLLELILFTIIFLYITNWGRIRLIFGGLSKLKVSFSNFTDKNFIDRVNKKAGLEFDIKVQNSDWIFGFMPGIPMNKFLASPIKPVMIISFGARKYLTDDELEWLALHEAGHCVLWHVLKSILAGLLILTLGLVGIYQFKMPLLLIPLYGLILAIFYYQIERKISEEQADIFSLNRISSPKAMITANEKMKIRVNSIFYQNKILTKLFTGSLTYGERIEMAKNKLKHV